MTLVLVTTLKASFLTSLTQHNHNERTKTNTLAAQFGIELRVNLVQIEGNFDMHTIDSSLNSAVGECFFPIASKERRVIQCTSRMVMRESVHVVASKVSRLESVSKLASA